MKHLLAFLRLGRPVFLGGGALLFALGAMIAVRLGHAIDWPRYALGQAAVTSFQWMTHYANDYFDIDADVANRTPTRWSGGSRVLVSGELSPEVARIASVIFAAIGLGLTGILSQSQGVVTGVTLIAIFLLAWEYSAPPLRMCGSGLGELDTVLVVTVLVPWLGFYLQAQEFEGARMLVIAITPLGLLQFAMLLAIEIPDADGDRATGKRTLVVRWGVSRTRIVYALFTGSAFLWFPVALLLGLPLRVMLTSMLPVPIALWRIANAVDCRDSWGSQKTSAVLERLTSFAVLLLVMTTLAELVGFALC